MRTEWRFRALIKELGGAAACVDLINKWAGHEAVVYETVKGWNTRNSIPSQYLPFLLMYAIDKGYVKDVRFLKSKGGNDF